MKAGPGAGDLEQAHADQHGAADPGHQARVPPGEGERPHRGLEAERHEQERDAKAEGVDEGENGTAGGGPARRRQRQHGGQRRPDARCPAEPEHHPEQRRAGQARFRAGGRAHDPAREGEPVEDSGEQEPEQDGQAAEDLRQQPDVAGQQVAEPAQGRAVRDEDDREPEDEQGGSGDHPGSRRGLGDRRRGHRRRRDRYSGSGPRRPPSGGSTGRVTGVSVALRRRPCR